MLVDRRLASDVRAIEGAAAAVAATRAKRCICSNSRTERLECDAGAKPDLKRFFEGRMFSALETPTGKPKPAPDVFLFAAEATGRRPGELTFVIEDSVHGIAAAKAAGMRVIGFTGAAHSYPGHADA